MKRTILTALTAALMATSALASGKPTPQPQTQSKDLYKTNLWSVTHHNVPDKGEMCSMGTGWTERNNVGSAFLLKFNLTDGLFIHFTKTTWRLTPGNTVKMITSLDNQTWTSITSVQMKDMLFTNFNAEQGTQFLQHFRDAGKLTIMFPNGSETPFPVKIDQKALTAFEACSASLIESSGDTVGEEEAPAQSNSITPPKYRGA
jgi:hypothetical protein